MKKQVVLLLLLLICSFRSFAQGPMTGVQPKDGMMGNLQNMQMDNFEVNVNQMDDETRKKLNQVAAIYRSKSRGAFTDISKSMLYGGVSSVFTVISNEIISLTKIRSQQKKKWMEMRQNECLFIDSLQSSKGQSDFYRKPSVHGALDPSDMNFDGITFRASRNGNEILKMVCHIDTTKFSHLFLHSKFYLVLDSVVFHPYQSYLPNLSANRIRGVDSKSSKEQIDYWNMISKFSFSEQQSPTINIRMDFSSSWINEAVQVYQDVKLGSFSVNIPINEMDLGKDSVYVYSRQEALMKHKQLIDITGDCFVIPRSYMPVAANNPSWGTGEYKMKVVMSERCQYNPTKGRSSNWHKDYKQLVRLQNHGKAKNEYMINVVSSFKESKDNIIKATYTPLINSLQNSLGLNATGSAAGSKMGAMGGMQGAGKTGSATGQLPQGAGQGMPKKP